MKYERLYNFISPVTGKIAFYSQLPDLPEKYIIIGDKNNKPIVSPILISILNDIDTLQIGLGIIQTEIFFILEEIDDIKDDIKVIKTDINVIKDNIEIIQGDISDIKIQLIDIRLNDMDMRFDIDAIKNISKAPFIIQTPFSGLSKAQALSDLDNGVLGNNNGVIEILQRVSGPIISNNNSIARFDGITGQVIKDSKVTIDDDGEVYANSLHVVNSLGVNTGFKASLLMSNNVLYKLPTTGGFPTQMLTTIGIPDLTDGCYQLYWSTPPSQITTDNPYEPSNPYPVFTTIPIPIPITTPFPVPVFTPTPGLPLGNVTASPVSIDPVKGDIDTPGDINANNANFDGDLSIDGDLSTEGNISANGSISGESFDFEDISVFSNDFVRMEAPFDLDHSYKIELPDNEPIMQEQIQSSNQRVLQTAWRRINPSQLNSRVLKATENDNLTITKLSWTELEVTDPITINFVAATETTNEKMVISYNGGDGQNIDIPYGVNLVYGILNNIDGVFKGFNSYDKDYLVKIKSSYYPIENSSSAIGILNRYDNGYILKNVAGNLKIQSVFNNNFVDLLNFSKTFDSFKFLKPLEILSPTSPYHPATKEYVDSTSGAGITQIIAGTGLTGGTITTSGTISIANTTVTAGNYRLGNFTVNSQGQLTSASSSSPSTTTTRSIAVWGNTIGTSLLNTSVLIDSSGNISSDGSSTFRAQQIEEADGLGSLNFMSNSYTLQVRLNQSLTRNILWFIPSNNANGFFKNNGAGTISWSSLTSSDINNFSNSVKQEFEQFSFQENTLKCTNNSLPMVITSNSNKTVLDNTVNIGTGLELNGKAIKYNSSLQFDVISASSFVNLTNSSIPNSSNIATAIIALVNTPNDGICLCIGKNRLSGGLIITTYEKIMTQNITI